MKTKYTLILILIAFAAGFFLGRETVRGKEIVREVKGETVYGEYPAQLLIPKKEIKSGIASLPQYFFKTITVTEKDTVYLKQVPDTVKVFDDFMTLREYKFTLFDNEKGKLDLSQSVQFNQLQRVEYSFIPIQKEIIRDRGKLFTLHATGSVHSKSGLGAGGGAAYKNVAATYQRFQDGSDEFSLTVNF